MNPRALTCLWAAMDHANAAVHFVDGRTRTEYESNRMLQSAVLNEVDKSSRSLARAIDYEIGIAAMLPDVRRLLALHHVLLPRYWEIDHDEVWYVVTTEIPPLSPLLREILNTYGDIPV